MAESAEGIGARKWSLLKDGDVVVVHQGITPLAALTPAGEQVKHLIVTAPQLWEAANDLLKVLSNIIPPDGPPGLALIKATERVGNMVAKSVDKADWRKVVQD